VDLHLVLLEHDLHDLDRRTVLTAIDRYLASDVKRCVEILRSGGRPTPMLR
jgi:hypothetical protein